VLAVYNSSVPSAHIGWLLLFLALDEAILCCGKGMRNVCEPIDIFSFFQGSLQCLPELNRAKHVKGKKRYHFELTILQDKANWLDLGMFVYRQKEAFKDGFKTNFVKGFRFYVLSCSMRY